MTLFFTILWTFVAGIVAVTVGVIILYVLFLGSCIAFFSWQEKRAWARHSRLHEENR